jgi:hypothetical protein
MEIWKYGAKVKRGTVDRKSVRDYLTVRIFLTP